MLGIISGPLTIRFEKKKLLLLCRCLTSRLYPSRARTWLSLFYWSIHPGQSIPSPLYISSPCALAHSRAYGPTLPAPVPTSDVILIFFEKYLSIKFYTWKSINLYHSVWMNLLDFVFFPGRNTKLVGRHAKNAPSQSFLAIYVAATCTHNNLTQIGQMSSRLK